MINREQITSRKQDLEKDTEATQTLIQGLERQREQAVQRLAALSGAIQQCDAFLEMIDIKEGDNEQSVVSSIPDKKKIKNS
jgi:phage shock protein A